MGNVSSYRQRSSSCQRAAVQRAEQHCWGDRGVQGVEDDPRLLSGGRCERASQAIEVPAQRAAGAAPTLRQLAGLAALKACVGDGVAGADTPQIRCPCWSCGSAARFIGSRGRVHRDPRAVGVRKQVTLDDPAADLRLA